VSKKQWQRARLDDAKLPFATEERWGHTATVCPLGSSNIYLIGGWDSRCQYGDTTLFDAKKNKLKKLDIDGIHARAGHSAVCIGTSIIVFGGAVCKGGPYKFYNDVNILETKNKSWLELVVGAEKPSPRSQHSAVALGDTHMLIMGGYTGGSLLDDVWCLDIKEAQWKRLIITSDEKGPKGFIGLPTTDFRVRPAAHTSILLRWNSGVGHILVHGLCGSDQPYLLTCRPALGTMEWKRLESTLSSAVTGHSYVSFTKPDKESEITVFTFGGIVNEKGGEPGTGRSNSYLRTFDVL